METLVFSDTTRVSTKLIMDANQSFEIEESDSPMTRIWSHSFSEKSDFEFDLTSDNTPSSQSDVDIYEFSETELLKLNPNSRPKHELRMKRGLRKLKAICIEKSF